MNWEIIGPIMLGLAAVITATGTILSRQDNRRTAQHAQELAEDAKSAKELETAWAIYKETFASQEKRLDQAVLAAERAEKRQLQAEERQLKAEERTQQQQRVIDGLQEEVRLCEARNVRSETSLADALRRITVLEEKLRDNGITTT